MCSKEPIRIIDVIDHRNKYNVQVELLLNRFPQPLFERRGNWLIGHDSGVFQFYRYEYVEPSWSSHMKAFGGNVFDIPMTDGNVTHATGQWWHGLPQDFCGIVYSHGISTAERLVSCYVFMGAFHVDCEIVDEWRKHNDPSNNYRKYDKRHETFGQHRIVSPWEAEVTVSAA